MVPTGVIPDERMEGVLIDRFLSLICTLRALFPDGEILLRSKGRELWFSRFEAMFLWRPVAAISYEY